MEIDQLLSFERAAREGSFSRAAWALGVAQPTISARIQSLEQAVGGPLFVRGGRRLALTELGESFLPYAQRALEVLAEGMEATRQTQAGQRGRVTVGTLQSLAAGFLAVAVEHFYALHPQTDLFVRTSHSEQIVAMLYDGVIKIGLISWPFFDPQLTPLLRFREPLVLVTGPQHPFAARDAVTLDAVQRAGNPFLIVRWGVAMNPVLSQIEGQGVPTVELPIETVQQLLRRGVGAAFLTRPLVADALGAGRLVEVPVAGLPPLFRESVLVRLERAGPLPSAVAEFVAVLRDEAGALLVAAEER